MTNETEPESGRQTNWRKRIWLGLAILSLLILLPLALLFGYGAWLNSRPSPWTGEPTPKRPALSRTTAQGSDRDQAPTSLTLARVQAFVNEPEVKALSDDYVTLRAKASDSSAKWSLGWFFSPHMVDDHWIACFDRHHEVLERVKQLVRQNPGRVINQQKVYGGGPEPPPEIRLFCFDLPNLLAAQGCLALQRGQEAEALENCRLLFAMGFPANPGYSLGLSWMSAESFLHYWLESTPPSVESCRVLSRMIDTLSTASMCLIQAAPEARKRECFRRLAETMQPYQQPWKSQIFGWNRDNYPQAPSPGPSPMNWVVAKSDYFVQSWRAIQNKAHAEEYLAACAAYTRQSLDPEQDYPTLHALKPPAPPRFDYGDRFSTGPSMNENIIAIHRQIPFERQTRFNLNRAALAWLDDPHSRPAAGAVNFHQAPTHPWRDPFTEQPFHVDQTATATLIYSLGPDLADQHGQLPYDPTNGAASAGDIVIHIGSNHAK